MKDYEPSAEFVSKVMAAVNAYEASDTRRTVLGSRPLQYAVCAGGVLLAIVNILRGAFMFIYPVLCR